MSLFSHWLSCPIRGLCRQQNRYLLAPFLSYVTNVLCLSRIFHNRVKSSIKQEGERRLLLLFFDTSVSVKVNTDLSDLFKWGTYNLI